LWATSSLSVLRFAKSICGWPGKRTRGEIVLAGALAEPADKALLIFRGSSGRGASQFAENDPYVRNGLVKRWEVRPWSVVMGDAQATIGGA